METTKDILVQSFGEEPAKFILDYLGLKTLRLKENSLDWGKNPKVFSDAARRILGAGAVSLERLVLKSLCSKFELKLVEKEGYEFSDYIKEVSECLGKRKIFQNE